MGSYISCLRLQPARLLPVQVLRDIGIPHRQLVARDVVDLDGAVQDVRILRRAENVEALPPRLQGIRNRSPTPTSLLSAMTMNW